MLLHLRVPPPIPSPPYPWPGESYSVTSHVDIIGIPQPSICDNTASTYCVLKANLGRIRARGVETKN